MGIKPPKRIYGIYDMPLQNENHPMPEKQCKSINERCFDAFIWFMVVSNLMVMILVFAIIF